MNTKDIADLFATATDKIRLSVANATANKIENEHIDLVLDDCRDLVTIEELPNE